MSVNLKAWQEAERVIFDALLRGAAHRFIEGKNAYLTRFPERFVNAWALMLSGGMIPNANAAMKSVKFNGEIMGRYLEKDDAQRVCCDIMAAMPFDNLGNGRVARCYAAAIPTISVEYVDELGGYAYTLRVPLEAAVRMT